MAFLVEVTPEVEDDGPVEYVTGPDHSSVLGPKVYALRFVNRADAELVAARLRASWVSYGHIVAVIDDYEAFPTLEAALAAMADRPRPWYRRVLDVFGL